MSAPDLAKLLFLSALWGASFIFLRVVSPQFGPLMTALLRTALAGMALIAYASASGVAMNWRRNLKPYAIVGLFAGAVPFSFFSFAALHLPAAHSAVLNSTAPLFGALFSTLWLAERLTIGKLAGLALGVVGVATLVGAGAITMNSATLLSIAAALMAAASCALASIIVIKTGGSGGIPPIAMATGSLAVGGLMLMPLLPFAIPPALPSLTAFASLAALALLSAAMAQALFIPLIVKIGATRAMTVTFLIPLFSMLWGFLFLGEAVVASTLVGALIVLAAMVMVLLGSRTKPAQVAGSR